MPRFAANIKRALNAAYGRVYKNRTWYNGNNQESNLQQHRGRERSFFHNYNNNYENYDYHDRIDHNQDHGEDKYTWL